MINPSCLSFTQEVSDSCNQTILKETRKLQLLLGAGDGSGVLMTPSGLESRYAPTVNKSRI